MFQGYNWQWPALAQIIMAWNRTSDYLNQWWPSVWISWMATTIGALLFQSTQRIEIRFYDMIEDNRKIKRVGNIWNTLCEMPLSCDLKWNKYYSSTDIIVHSFKCEYELKWVALDIVLPPGWWHRAVPITLPIIYAYWHVKYLLINRIAWGECHVMTLIQQSYRVR